MSDAWITIICGLATLTYDVIGIGLIVFALREVLRGCKGRRS
jgi:hypothetical protein